MAKFEFKEDFKFLKQPICYKEDDVFDLIHRGEIISIKEKVKNGLNINLRNDNDQTLLHYAVLYRQTEIAKFLILSGACLDTKDKNEQTIKEAIQNYYPNFPDPLDLYNLNHYENKTSSDISFPQQEIIGENKCILCILY